MLSQGRSDEEIHAHYCANRKVGSALVVVAFCALEVFLSWRLLGREFSAYRVNGLLADLILIGVGVRLILIFRCLRERIVIGVAIVRGFVGLISMAIPNLLNPFAGTVRFGIVSLWVLAFLVGLSMLVDSVRAPKLNAEITETDIKAKQGLLLVVGVLVALFIIGALVYFFPR